MMRFVPGIVIFGSGGHFFGNKQEGSSILSSNGCTQ